MSTLAEVSNSFGESDKARIEAYVSALQYKYPRIDGNELEVLKANKLREKLLYDSIEKEKKSLRLLAELDGDDSGPPSLRPKRIQEKNITKIMREVDNLKIENKSIKLLLEFKSAKAKNDQLRQSISQSCGEENVQDGSRHTNGHINEETEDGQNSLYSMKPDEVPSTYSVDSWDFSIESETFYAPAVASAPLTNSEPYLTPYARHDDKFFAAPVMEKASSNNLDSTLSPYARHDNNFFSSPVMEKTMSKSYFSHANDDVTTAQGTVESSDCHNLQCTDYLDDDSSDGSGHFILQTSSMDDEEDEGDDKFEYLYTDTIVPNLDSSEIEEGKCFTQEEVNNIIAPVSPPPDITYMKKSSEFSSQHELELEPPAKSIKSVHFSANEKPSTATSSFLKQLLPLSIFQSNDAKKSVVYDFTEFVDNDDLDSDNGMLNLDVNFCSANDILTSLDAWTKENVSDKDTSALGSWRIEEDSDSDISSADTLRKLDENGVNELNKYPVMKVHTEGTINKEVNVQVELEQAEALAYQEEQIKLQRLEEKKRLQKEAELLAAVKERKRLSAMSKKDIIAEQVQRLKDVGIVTKQKSLLEQRRVEAYRQTEFSIRQAQIDSVKQQVTDVVTRIEKKKQDSEIIKKLRCNNFTERVAATVFSMVSIISAPMGSKASIDANEYVEILLQHCIEHAISSSSYSSEQSNIYHNDSTFKSEMSPLQDSNRKHVTDRYSEFASYTPCFQANEEDLNAIKTEELAPIKSRNQHLVNISESNLIRPKDYQFDVPFIIKAYPLLCFVSNVSVPSPTHVSIDNIYSFIQYPQLDPLKMHMSFFVTISAIGDSVDSDAEEFRDEEGDDWSDNLSKDDFVSILLEEFQNNHKDNKVMDEDVHSEHFTVFENLNENSSHEGQTSSAIKNTTTAMSLEFSLAQEQSCSNSIQINTLPLSNSIGEKCESESPCAYFDGGEENDSLSAISDFKIMHEEYESDISVTASGAPAPSSLIPSSEIEEKKMEQEKQKQIKLKSISKINRGGISLAASESSQSNSAHPGNGNLSIDLDSHFSSYLSTPSAKSITTTSLPMSIQTSHNISALNERNENENEIDTGVNHNSTTEGSSKQQKPNLQHQSEQLQQRHLLSKPIEAPSVQEVFVENAVGKQYKGPQAYVGPGAFELEDIYDDDEDSLYDDDNYFNEELLDASASIMSNLTFDTAILMTESGHINSGRYGRDEEVFVNEFGAILGAAERERSSYLNDLDTQPLPLEESITSGHNGFEGSDMMDLYSIEEGDPLLDNDEMSQRKGNEINLFLSGAILVRAREDDRDFRKQNRAHVRALQTAQLHFENQSRHNSTKETVLYSTKKIKNNFLERNKWVKHSACRKNDLIFSGVPEDIPGYSAVQCFANELICHGDNGISGDRERNPDENYFYPGSIVMPNWDILDY